MRRGRRVVGGVVAAVVGLLALLPASASAAEADTTPPVLRSVAFSTSALTAAGSVTLILDATDDVAVTRASVTFLEDSSHRYVYVQDSETPLTLGTYFGLNAANGTYRAYQVRLTDAAGNYADYRLDGRYRSSPASAESTHEVDLAGPSVTLSGASDGTAPVLTALRPVTEATRVGEASTYAWAATDSEHSVASIEARFLNPHMGVTVGSGVVPAGEGAGTLSIVPSEFGPWELYMVEVVDSVGNRAFYYPDGQAVMEGALFPRTHGLPLATLGSTVAPGDFGATVVERPGRLTVALSTDVDPTHLSSIRVEASPSGTVRETPLGRGGSFLVDLPDLPEARRANSAGHPAEPVGRQPHTGPRRAPRPVPQRDRKRGRHRRPPDRRPRDPATRSRGRPASVGLHRHGHRPSACRRNVAVLQRGGVRRRCRRGRGHRGWR